MWHGSDLGWWMTVNGILWVPLVGFLVYVAVQIVGRWGRSELLEIVERRYARGEIDREQYERARSDLRDARRMR